MKCPNGHEVTAQHGGPICEECGLIATHYNTKTGEVYHWSTFEEHEQAVENLQDAMDEAFDNQYFSD